MEGISVLSHLMKGHMKKLSKTQYDVLENIKSKNLIQPNSSVCVALSGGMDSCVLLHIMFSIKDYIPFNLSVCHLNHKLRGDESERDKQFCIELCKKYDIPLFTQDFDVIKYQELIGKSLEDAAREVRYSWFNNLKDENKLDYIVTAHHKNDQAETILFHAIRGTSISGLTGIPEKRDCIVRPLLNVSKKEIEEYAIKHNLEYIIDSSNSDTKYTRNYIRHIVFPELEKINPSFIESLIRIANDSKIDENYFDSIITDIDLNDDLSNYDPAIVKRMISKKYHQETGRTLCFYHVNSILNAIINKEIKSFEISNHLLANCNRGRLSFDRKTEIENTSFDITLKDGNNIIDDIKCSIVLGHISDNNEIINNLSTNCFLRKENIYGKIRCRNRKPGDKIIEFGVSKSVKKIMSERRIDIQLRNRIPIFYDDVGILYIPFVAISDRVFTKNTGSSLHIQTSFYD